MADPTPSPAAVFGLDPQNGVALPTAPTIDVGGPSYSPQIPAGQQGSQQAVPKTPVPASQTPSPGSVFGLDPSKGTFIPPPMTASPNPHDLLATSPPTFGQTAGAYGGVIGRNLLESTPLDWPGSLYNLGASNVNRFAGTNLPMVSTPGQRWSEDFGFPEAKTLGENIAGAEAGQIGSAFWGAGMGKLFGLGPEKYWSPSLARQVLLNAGVGVGQGVAARYDADPDVQAAIGLGGLAAGAKLTPGQVTKASARDLQLADVLRSPENQVPVNPTDLGGAGQKAAYGFTSAGLWGGGKAFVQRQARAWVDAVARRWGGTSDDGLLTEDVLNEGYNRTSGMYNSLNSAQDTPLGNVNDPTSLNGKMQAAVDNANKFGQDSRTGVILGNIVNDLRLAAAAHGNALPASMLTDALNTQQRLSKLARAPTNDAEYFQSVRDALNDHFRTVLTPTEQATLDAAKNNWRSLNTAERATDAGTSIITPQSLATAVKNSKYETRGGDYDKLAKAGVRFVAPVVPEKPVSAYRPSVGGLIKGGVEGGIGLGAAADVLGFHLPNVSSAGELAGLGLAAGVLPAMGQLNRAARWGSLSPAAPTIGPYLAGQALSPNLYMGPQRPGLPGSPVIPGVWP